MYEHESDAWDQAINNSVDTIARIQDVKDELWGILERLGWTDCLHAIQKPAWEGLMSVLHQEYGNEEYGNGR